MSDCDRFARIHQDRRAPETERQTLAQATRFRVTRSYNVMELARTRTSITRLFSVVVLLLLCGQAFAACVVPIVRPSLNAIPNEALKRSDYLKTTEASPGPESRSTSSSRASKVEVVLATIAAVLAGFFAANAYDGAEANAIVGIGGSFDETALFGKGAHGTETSDRVADDSKEGAKSSKKKLPPWLPDVE
ncbi:MAG: hypothetical protein GY811_26495 [Myxococcales bacterium]|nr:hypothetical protein [Myxococcales bacterium]